MTPPSKASEPGAVEHWLRRIPIRRRIFLLLSLNLAIACVLVLLAWRYDAAQDRFQRQSEALYSLDLTLQRVERDSDRLQALVRQYLARPEPSTQYEVRKLAGQLDRRITETAAVDAAAGTRLREAQAALRRLVDGFNILVELKPQIIGTYEARVLKAGRETSGLFAIIDGTLLAGHQSLLAPSVGKAREAFVDAMLNLNAYYLRPESESPDRAKSSLARIAGAIPVMLDLASDGLQRDALAAIGARVRTLDAGLEELDEMFGRQYGVLSGEIDPGAASLTALINSILGDSRERRAGLKTAYENERSVALVVLIVVAAVVIAAGATMSWLIAQSIRRPLDQLMGTVSAFAAGDLDRDVEDRSSSDEVGALVRMLEVFRSNALARRAAEDALRRSEEQHRIVVDNAAEGIVIVQDQLMVFANPRVFAISGYGPEEVTGHWFLEYVHPDDRAHAMRGVRQEADDAAGTMGRTQHLRLFTRAGRWVVLEVTSVAINWQGGTATLNFFTDVTERVQLEETLRRTLAEREAVLNSTLVGITLSVDRVHQWVNRRFAEMLGYEPAALIGRSSRVHFPDEESYQALGRTAYPQIAADGSYTTECQMRRKDGELIWVELYGQAIDRADPGKGTIWTFVDVTARKRLGEELRRTSSEREAILNNALVGIGFAVNRRRQWVNRRFAEMMGFEREELIGKTSRMHFPDDGGYEAFARAADAELVRCGTYSAELQLRRKDNSPIWVELHGTTAMAGDPEKGVIWTAVDVTERREAEESMRLALQQQKDLSDLKSRFVSMASHEFRTPLATILSSAELMRDYGERLEATERAELLQNIQGSVKRMTELLDQVLVIGRADAGRLAFRTGPVDLEQFCRRVAREAEHLEGRPDGAASRLALHVAGECRTGELDEKLLHHILGNLLSNALKYTPAGGSVSLQVHCERAQSTFIVSDAGIGIPEKDLPHLFETFHRASNVGNIQGTGLGLAIVKRAVELHGGAIGVTSAPGEGTRFEVRLPHGRGANASG